MIKKIKILKFQKRHDKKKLNFKGVKNKISKILHKKIKL